MEPDKRDNSKKILTIFLIFVVSFAAFSYLHDTLKMFFVERNFSDFAHYYFWAEVIVQRHINPFNLTDEERIKLKESSSIPVHISGTYPDDLPDYNPAFFVFFYPLTKISFNIASLSWVIFNNSLLIFSLFLCSKLLRIPVRDKYFWLTALFFIYASQPLRENIGIGQINIFILFLLILQLYYSVKSELLSGFILALVILMKSHFAFFLVFYIIKKKYKLIFSAIFSFIALNLFSLKFINSRIITTHYKRLLSLLTAQPLSCLPDNFSIYGFWGRLWGGGSFSCLVFPIYIFTSLLFLIHYLIISSKDKKGDSLILHFSTYLALFLIIAPLTSEHYLVLAFVPLLVAWKYIYRCKIEKLEVLLLLGAVLLILSKCCSLRFTIFQEGLLSVFSAFKTYGLILLYLFLTRLIASGNKLISDLK